MGRGCGPLSGRVTLKCLQRSLGNSFLRVDNTGDVYTFVNDYEIGEELEVVFELNDQLIINEGVTLTVEGKMDITENTTNITRINVLGVLNIETTSHIEFGDIELELPLLDDAMSIGLLISGNLNLNNGKITFNTIKNNGFGIAFNFNGNMTTNGGIIEIETITNKISDDELRPSGLVILGQEEGGVNNLNFNRLNLHTKSISDGGSLLSDNESNEVNIIFSESNITVDEIIGVGLPTFQERQTYGIMAGSFEIYNLTNESSVITIGKMSNAAIGMLCENANITNKKDIIFNEINSNSTVILFVERPSTLVNEENARIKVLAGDNDNTNVFKIDTFIPSLVSNLGPDGAIDMSNTTTTPYSPAFTDPLDAPWNGGDTPTRSFYAP